MKTFIFYLSILVSTLVSFTTTAESESQAFSDAELAQMLAPIALYPDSLLTHILIAATYPIEIVEAHRWLKKNDNLNTEQKNQILDEFDWDASVKALIPFEHVLSRLSEDLSWTRELGDAFLHDESRLLQSIQTLRKQAKLAGSLNKMDNMDIDYEDNNISILSQEKDVVYVPYYDSRMVYGTWFWSAYPPVYWHPFRSAYVSHYRPFYWHSGVHITFNYFFSAFHWHNRHVVVVNPRGGHYRYSHQRPRRLIANGGYAKRWSHKPSHRKGVAYRTKRTSEKYGSKHVGAHRVSNKLNASHQKFKQKLHTPMHSPKKINIKTKQQVSHKLNHKANHKAKHKAKQNNAQSRQTSKGSAIPQKTQRTDARQNKQNRQISQQTREQKLNANKRVASSVRKEQRRVNQTSSHKASRQNGASTKRHNSMMSKDRK